VTVFLVRIGAFSYLQHLTVLVAIFLAVKSTMHDTSHITHGVK